MVKPSSIDITLEYTICPWRQELTKEYIQLCINNALSRLLEFSNASITIGDQHLKIVEKMYELDRLENYDDHNEPEKHFGLKGPRGASTIEMIISTSHPCRFSGDPHGYANISIEYRCGRIQYPAITYAFILGETK